MAEVAIVGAGFIGRAWAISFARAGHKVALWDEKPDAADAALGYIAEVLPDLADNDLLDGRTPDAVLAAMRTQRDLAAALEGADHVQENTPEDVNVKRSVFARLDQLARPDAVLASSTSAILPSKFTEHLSGRA